jgi:hypothetical protein
MRGRHRIRKPENTILLITDVDGRPLLRTTFSMLMLRAEERGAVKDYLQYDAPVKLYIIREQ